MQKRFRNLRGTAPSFMSERILTSIVREVIAGPVLKERKEDLLHSAKIAKFCSSSCLLCSSSSRFLRSAFALTGSVGNGSNLRSTISWRLFSLAADLVRVVFESSFFSDFPIDLWCRRRKWSRVNGRCVRGRGEEITLNLSEVSLDAA